MLNLINDTVDFFLRSALYLSLKLNMQLSDINIKLKTTVLCKYTVYAKI